MCTIPFLPTDDDDEDADGCTDKSYNWPLHSIVLSGEKKENLHQFDMNACGGKWLCKLTNSARFIFLVHKGRLNKHRFHTHTHTPSRTNLRRADEKTKIPNKIILTKYEMNISVNGSMRFSFPFLAFAFALPCQCRVLFIALLNRTRCRHTVLQCQFNTDQKKKRNL